MVISNTKPFTLLKTPGFTLYFSFIFSLIASVLFAPAIYAASAQTNQGMAEHVQKNATTNSAEMAKQSMALHSETLQQLMLALYQQNPKQLKKSTQVSAEEMVQWIFEGPFGWKFDGVRRLQGIDALNLAIDANFPGDRVLALIAGLQTMLAKAYGGKTEYDFSGEIDPQILYNAARNVEIAGIKINQLSDGLLFSNDKLDLSTTDLNPADLKPSDLKPTDLTHQLSALISRVDADAKRIAEQKKQVIQLLDKNTARTTQWQSQ